MSFEAEVSPVVGRPVPRTYRVPALFRDLLSVFGRMPSLISIWIGGRLPRALREKVIVAVSQANACRMCEHAHTRMALEAGVTDAELAALENMDSRVLDRRTWLALAFARERVRTDFAPIDGEESHRTLVSELGLQTIRDIEALARAMTIANRIANTLNALPDRMRGQAVSESRLADELLITVLFLPGAWLGTLIAALRQRTSPFRVWRQARG